MKQGTFATYARHLQERARVLGFEVPGYRMSPHARRVVQRYPQATVVCIQGDSTTPDAEVLDALWTGTCVALGLALDDPMSASFRPDGIAPRVRSDEDCPDDAVVQQYLDVEAEFLGGLGAEEPLWWTAPPPAPSTTGRSPS